MGHDEAQARQAALVKFVRLMKASANDMVSEVEAISFTGDITQLSNYELTVVIQQLQAQLFSNLNPHRPSGITASEPEPTPATPATPAVSVVEEPAAMNLLESFEYASNQVQNLRERMEQGDRKLYRSVGEFMDSTDSTIQNLAAEALEPAPAPEPTPEPDTREERRAARQAQAQVQILNSADGWTSNGKNEKIDLFFLFQEVEQDYDALHDALKCYSRCELARCAYKNKLAKLTVIHQEWDKNQLIEELVQFVKNQRETWGTPATPAEPAPATPTPAAPTPATPAEPAPEANRLRLFILFEEVGLDSDALHEALKHYTKPALVRVARQYKLAGKTALDKFKTSQLIEELVKYAVREVNRGSCFLKDEPAPDARVPKTHKPQRGEPADWKTQHLVVQGVAGEPEPGLSWLDNPEAFTL